MYKSPHCLNVVSQRDPHLTSARESAPGTPAETPSLGDSLISAYLVQTLLCHLYYH